VPTYSPVGRQIHALSRRRIAPKLVDSTRGA
jgi:hypothetical protein